MVSVPIHGLLASFTAIHGQIRHIQDAILMQF